MVSSRKTLTIKKLLMYNHHAGINSAFSVRNCI